MINAKLRCLTVFRVFFEQNDQQTYNNVELKKTEQIYPDI